MNQLNRSESLLRQLFEKLGINFHIEGFLVFVNPEFYLYHAPIDQHIIFPTQINRFISKLNSIPSKLNTKHHNLTDKLLEICLEKSPYSQVPHYIYDDLKKGFSCAKCHALATAFEGQKIKCDLCGYKESLQSAVLRSVEERSLLFPELKITTNSIMEWCDTDKHPITIHRILRKNFIAIGHGKAMYYVYK